MNFPTRRTHTKRSPKPQSMRNPVEHGDGNPGVTLQILPDRSVALVQMLKRQFHLGGNRLEQTTRSSTAQKCGNSHALSTQPPSEIPLRSRIVRNDVLIRNPSESQQQHRHNARPVFARPTMKQRAAILPKGVNRLHHASDARSVIVEQPLVHRRHAIWQCVTKLSRIELIEHLNMHVRHAVSAAGIRIGPMTNLKIAAQIDDALQTLSVLLQIFIISRRQFAKRRTAKKDAICCFPLRAVLRPIRMPAQIAHVSHASKRKLLGAGGMNCGIAPLSCNYHMRQSTLRIEALIHWILPCGLYTTSYRSVFATCLRNAYGILLCLEMPESPKQRGGYHCTRPALSS